MNLAKRYFFTSFFVVLFFCGLLKLTSFGLQLLKSVPSQQVYLKKLAKKRFLNTTTLYDQKGYKLSSWQNINHIPLKLSEIPLDLQKAFLVAEDASFFKHSGFDFFAIVRSFWVNLTRLKLVQGASTITQQLARMYFLEKERSMMRKLKELILAFRIERDLSKNEILELYLNSLYLGAGTYGVEAASRRYFRKKVSQLNLAEAALIAGLPRAPSALAPHRFYQRALKRQKKILKLMMKKGVLSKQKYSYWLNKPPVVTQVEDQSSLAGSEYFVYYLRNIFKRQHPLLATYESPLHIQTSLNFDSQKKAQEVLFESLKILNRGELAADKKQVQASLISLDYMSGEVHVMQGGSSYKNSQFNRAVYSKRPIAALFIPFLLALSYKKKIPYSTLIGELKKNLGERRPTYFDKSIYQAFLDHDLSRLLPLTYTLGTRVVRNFLSRFKLNPFGYETSWALGKNKVSPLQVALAYASFFNQGVLKKARFIRKINKEDGSDFQLSSSWGRRVLSPKIAASVSFALEDNFRYGLSSLGMSDEQKYIGMSTVSKDKKDAWVIVADQSLLHCLWLGSEFGKTRLQGSKEQIIQNISFMMNEYLRRIDSKSLSPRKVLDKQKISLFERVYFYDVRRKLVRKNVPFSFNLTHL